MLLVCGVIRNPISNKKPIKGVKQAEMAPHIISLIERTQN